MAGTVRRRLRGHLPLRDASTPGARRLEAARRHRPGCPPVPGTGGGRGGGHRHPGRVAGRVRHHRDRGARRGDQHPLLPPGRPRRERRAGPGGAGRAGPGHRGVDRLLHRPPPALLRPHRRGHGRPRRVHARPGLPAGRDRRRRRHDRRRRTPDRHTGSGVRAARTRHATPSLPAQPTGPDPGARAGVVRGGRAGLPAAVDAAGRHRHGRDRARAGHRGVQRRRTRAHAVHAGHLRHDGCRW